MKKVFAILLALSMVFGFAACSKANSNNTNSASVKVSDDDKSKKTEYYKTWALSDDFGVAGEYYAMNLDLNGVKFVMDVTNTHMIVAVGESEIALYEVDNKAYVCVKSKSDDGKITESWSVANIPDDAESMLTDSDDNRFGDGSAFGEAEYVDTINEDGVTYDILNVKGEAMFGDSDEKDHTYKAYVNADTHKLYKVEIEEEMKNEEADSNTAENIKIKGAVIFNDGTDTFKAPEKAEEAEYDDIMMTFAFGMLGIMMDSPEVAAFMN